MRFVEPKSEEQQAGSIAFRTREQLLKQRTDCINSLRSHLQEFGSVAPQGIGYLSRLEDVVEDPHTDLPVLARRFCRELLDHIAQLTLRIGALKKTIGEAANRGATARRLQTMPDVGPISALAIETFAPPMEQFRRGRDFAPWLGLVPRQNSSGGNPHEAALGAPRAWRDRLVRLLPAPCAAGRDDLGARRIRNGWPVTHESECGEWRCPIVPAPKRRPREDTVFVAR